MRENEQKDIEYLAKIKKVLVEVSKHVYRDLEFFYQADNKDKRRRIYNKEIEYNPENAYSIVCRTLCQIVSNICISEHKLNVELIRCDKDEFGHVDLLFTAPSGKKYIINCLSDLERIQLGMKTSRFASEQYFDERYGKILNKNEFSFLNEDEQKCIDNKIGYIRYMYTDELFKLLRDEFDSLKNILKEEESLRKTLLGENAPIEDVDKITLEQLTNIKVQFLLDYFNRRGGIIGYIELVRIYKIVSKLLFTKDELKIIHVTDCFFDRKGKNLEEKIWDTGEERVRFLKFKLGDDIYIITTVGNTYLHMHEEEYETFKEKNGVHEKEISKGDGIISENIRNKGMGINILKHPIVWNSLKELDKIAGTLSCEKVDELVRRIQQSPNEDITFQLKGNNVRVRLEENKIDITIAEKRHSYSYKNDELTVASNNETYVFHWKDEGSYEMERV